ncbi:UDP-N-acetylglucosamine--N-acetylmuramyl-(pentapeptide) pyrophosphoryl-undecaprenol N-acetylglucosamine transferase [Candidatus Peregrinibacteria bacterium]|nr:UDP-N-acetylglucosamine--N-acetylmuramyl-(pentapeptide) pyrophosphoryl-undecaprenol N-acetylglucosamine transferase [Candidatus Peregrinibacteria bacterium]
MNILCVGGGSVGHTAPAVAVIRAIQKEDPKAEIHMICSPREDEAAFLRVEKIPFTTLPIPRRNLFFPFQFLRSYREALSILERTKPAVIFSKGGGLSLPACFAAMRRRIPIVLHESDARTGLASRLIAWKAVKVCTGFPGVKLRPDEVWTGNPVRPQITMGDRTQGLRRTGLSGARPILLITGGSQGAQSFNEVVREHLADLLLLCDVIHLTGRGKQTISEKKSGYFAEEFALDDLPHLYACATLALSRGGAGSISELAANGIPTIVVPLEGVAQNHQVENAKRAAAGGGARLLLQAKLRSNLLSEVRSLLAHPEKLREMSVAMRSLSLPDAAEKIAHFVLRADRM